MTRFLRTLWRRLLPPGGDVATAREPDNREAFIPGSRVLRASNCRVSIGYLPQRFGDANPEPHDLGPDDHCWWWSDPTESWELTNHDLLEPGDLWLPYWAIAHPTTEP
jgi:hypothetical protein